MNRQLRNFKIIAAIISIPLLVLFLIGYSYIIFILSDELNDISYYFLLVLGFLGLLLWARISVHLLQEIKSLHSSMHIKS